MGIRPLFYRCLLISPSDVAEHREAVARAIELWNAHSGHALDARIELIRWEVHGRPDSSGPPQAVLNRQIVDQADLAIALFWSRLGTPTEMAESGSAEEIRLLTSRNAQVLIYRCSAPIPQAALHNDQFKLMEGFLQEQGRHGFIGSYADAADIYKQVLMHLTTVIGELAQRDRDQPSPTSGLLTAITPDVRVRVQAALVGRGPMVRVVRVSVENHSPITVFMASIFVVYGTQMIFIQQDCITREYQLKRTLEAGQSYGFHISPHDILAVTSVDDLQCIRAKDAIGRHYDSTREELIASIKDSLVDDQVEGGRLSDE